MSVPSTGVPPVIASGSFLVPNGTFVAELIGFLLIAWFFGVRVVPRVNAMLTERQESIRKAHEDADSAKESLEKAQEEYREQIAGARADAARQKEEAREQGAQILAELKAQAHQESDRIIKAAQQQI